MTEQEWLTGRQPILALEFVRKRASTRKLRLFSCAYWRWLAISWKSDRCLRAVQTAERFVDGLCDREEFAAVHYEVARAANQLDEWFRDPADHSLVTAARAATESDAYVGASDCILDDSPAAAMVGSRVNLGRGTRHTALEETRGFVNFFANLWHEIKTGTVLLSPKEKAQLIILRDLFVNPFHPVSADPCWRSIHVMGLADGIYEDRDFDRLPILADALEEAGCTDAEILSHCRGPGPHVRGCWVVDLLLGKE
jgi:hypothetical protein